MPGKSPRSNQWPGKTAEEIRDAYNEEILEAYEEIERRWHIWTGRYRRKLFSELEGHVVDVACGPGDNFRYMSESADIVAVDISPDVLEWAQQEATVRDMSVTFKQMDAQNLAFEDDSFDTVISTLSTCTFPDPVQALNEMGRVCHPDGEVRLLEHGKSTFTPYRKVQEWRRDSYVDNLGCRLLEDPAEIVEESDLTIEVEQKWWIGTLTGIVAHPSEG